MSLAFLPSGQQLVSSSLDGTARLWDVATGKELMVFRAHEGGIRSVAVSPDGKTLATAGGGDNTVRFWKIPQKR